MDFLHYEIDAGPANTVEVQLDRQANVLLLDRSNFESYRHGRDYRYFGGRAVRSPVRLTPPRTGHWHVVIDLGGASGSVRASCRVF